MKEKTAIKAKELISIMEEFQTSMHNFKPWRIKFIESEKGVRALLDGDIANKVKEYIMLLFQDKYNKAKLELSNLNDYP